MRVPILVCCACALFACGEEDELAPPDGAAEIPDSQPQDVGAPGVDGGLPDGGLLGPDAGSEASDAQSARDSGPELDAGSIGPTEGLQIRFDYRFDVRGFFLDPLRRTVLEHAALIWGGHLADDFAAIPRGTEVRTRDPEDPTAPSVSFAIDEPIDDVLIFVGCANFAVGTAQSNHSAAIEAVSDPVLREELRARYRGSDFEPWTGWISFQCLEDWYFDATPEDDTDIPGASGDFLSTAMHEIGHVLGFGTADAFRALLDQTPSFIGPGATALYGGPVPMTPDGVHLDSAVRSDGRPTLMDPSRTIGTRTPPTSLDVTVMGDIGYQTRL